MDRIILALALLSVTSFQLVQMQQPNVDPKPQGPQTGSGGSMGFMPIMTEELRSSGTGPETSSVQSRDYSGGSEFYGYNYPASYGPPSSSYGSPGKSNMKINKYV